MAAAMALSSLARLTAAKATRVSRSLRHALHAHRWHVPTYCMSQSEAHGGMDHVPAETPHRPRGPNLGSVENGTVKRTAKSGRHGSRATRSFPSSRKRPPGASTDKPGTKAQVCAVHLHFSLIQVEPPRGMKSSCVKQLSRKSAPRQCSGRPARASRKNLRCKNN